MLLAISALLVSGDTLKWTFVDFPSMDDLLELLKTWHFARFCYYQQCNSALLRCSTDRKAQYFINFEHLDSCCIEDICRNWCTRFPSQLFCSIQSRGGSNHNDQSFDRSWLRFGKLAVRLDLWSLFDIWSCGFDCWSANCQSWLGKSAWTVRCWFSCNCGGQELDQVGWESISWYELNMIDRRMREDMKWLQVVKTRNERLDADDFYAGYSRP